MTVRGQVSAVRVDRGRGTWQKEREMKDVIWKLAGFLTVLGMAAPSLPESERWIWYGFAIGGVLLVIVAAVVVPRRSTKRGRRWHGY